MTDIAVLALVLGLAAGLWWWWRRRDGLIREGHPGERLSSADRESVGAPDDAVVLLEFTAPGCRPCAATRGALEQVAAERPDVVVATADVGDHLRLARAHGVLRAPTTLVVDRAGIVRHRIAGVPPIEDLAAAVDADVRAL